MWSASQETVSQIRRARWIPLHCSCSRSFSGGVDCKSRRHDWSSRLRTATELWLLRAPPLTGHVLRACVASSEYMDAGWLQEATGHSWADLVSPGSAFSRYVCCILCLPMFVVSGTRWAGMFQFGSTSICSSLTSSDRTYFMLLFSNKKHTLSVL
jgi:hypothetical protein